jgi:hypothetical protein
MGGGDLVAADVPAPGADPRRRREKCGGNEVRRTNGMPSADKPMARRLSKRRNELMMTLKRTHYLEPTQESGRAFVLRAIQGEVVMLNLLRFREIADYSANPELMPEAPISGSEAYDRYITHTMPYLKASGGDLLFFGEGDRFLIGPEHEHWDRAMLVRQSSVQSFMAFAMDATYLAGIGHRTAALEDSRLLPLVELPQPA